MTAIEAIRREHLKANAAQYEADPKRYTLRWNRAWLDPGGTIFGPGPYAKVPVTVRENGMLDEIVIRVYPTARLRRQLKVYR